MILFICLCFLVMLLVGMPIAVILGSTTALSLFFFTDTPLHIVGQQLFAALDNFVLLAVPFFILAGSIMTNGGIAKRLINFVNVLVGWFPGGLGIAGILACIFFAAISGSSPATVVAIGSIMLPALLKAGYGEHFSLGLITVSGSLGIVIPPSIPMILYCLVMNVSVKEMFMAGIVPGLFMGLCLMIYTYVIARKKNWRIEKKVRAVDVLHAFRRGFWAILLPLVVLGGIYCGLFTPTEAAAVSVVYALLVEICVYREIKITQITAVCQQAAVLSACLLFILSCAMTFLWLLTSQQVPQHLADLVIAHIHSPWLFLLCVNLLLLVLGCFMDDVSAMLILAPLFYETLRRFHIDFVHFGIVMVLNIQMGMLTPPFGLNLFVTSGLTKKPLATITRGVLPFVGLMLFCLLCVTYIPMISLFLPKLLLH